LDPTYDIQLVLCRKLHLFLEKSTKTADTRFAVFDSNMHQIVCRLVLRPRPHWVSLQRSPDPLAVFRELHLKGRKGRGRERRKEGGRKGERKGEEGKREAMAGEGREFVLYRRKKKKSRRLCWVRQSMTSQKWSFSCGIRTPRSNTRFLVPTGTHPR